MGSQTAIPNHQSLCTISAVPDALFRAFETEEYARRFLAGEVRFGLLQGYRRMEGCRRDETEGRASIRWNLKAENPNLVNVTYSGTSSNPYYALCTLAPAGKSHLADFGLFALRIRQPLTLLKRICEAWKNDARASGDAFIVPVLYNKDELVTPPPYYIAPPCLVYAQKPAKYSDEAEYRYLISCKVGTTEEPLLTLRIGSCDDICSPLLRL
jgi:hypothetical protein